METSYADWQIDLDDIKIISDIESSSTSGVFLCTWRKYQTVVMKVVEGHSDRELCILAKCLHPNVCQFLGACMRQGKTYMIFEYMPLGNLRCFLRMNPSSMKKLSIAKDVCIGLDYLSNRKPNPVIHRDIKPENVLIGHNIAKLCDFGISKLTDTGSPARHTGEVGSVRWTAPEVLLSQDYNVKSDVYSYGMLLKYLWSGVLPYVDHLPFQAAFAKMNHVKDDLSVIDDDSIRELVERCTSFDCSPRPTYAQIIDRLNEITYQSISI